MQNNFVLIGIKCRCLAVVYVVFMLFGFSCSDSSGSGVDTDNSIIDDTGEQDTGEQDTGEQDSDSGITRDTDSYGSGVDTESDSEFVIPDGWISEWVYYDTDGFLEYKEGETGDTIPDFSGVGYKKGEIPPDINVVMTLEPEPGENDDYKRIQDAIDSMGLLPLNDDGFRGALLLKKGVYRISAGLFINKSGVVLRGEGSDPDNQEESTVIIATKPENYRALSIRSGTKIEEVEGSRVKIADEHVPVGAKKITVESAQNFSPGDDIMIFRPGTAEWIHDIKMDRIPPRADGNPITQWEPEVYNTRFEREVVSVYENTITIDQPVVMAIDVQYGGGEIFKFTESKRVTNCGVEDILFKSAFDDTVIEQQNDVDFYADESHAMTAVVVKDAVDCWVRRVTSLYFGYSTVDVSGKYISVLDCNYLEPVSKISGGRRYSFGLNGQMGLVKNCHADKGRHSFVTGPRVAGPNVFTQSTATNVYADIGPHQRWAMGFLYDVLYTNGWINAQDRQSMGSGHGWSGVNQIIWNCDAAGYSVNSPWVTGKNYVIGSRGTSGKLVNKEAPPGIFDGLGETSSPDKLQIESLYEAQIIDKIRRGDK